MTEDEKNLKEKDKATVSGIIHAISISSEIFIAICETGVWGFEGSNGGINEYKDNHEKDVSS